MFNKPYFYIQKAKKKDCFFVLNTAPPKCLTSKKTKKNLPPFLFIPFNWQKSHINYKSGIKISQISIFSWSHLLFPPPWRETRWKSSSATKLTPQSPLWLMFWLCTQLLTRTAIPPSSQVCYSLLQGCSFLKLLVYNWKGVYFVYAV